jgi:hypothetical protein
MRSNNRQCISIKGSKFQSSGFPDRTVSFSVSVHSVHWDGVETVTLMIFIPADRSVLVS